jgi:hypothetical protein
MDTNSFLIFGLAVLVILVGLAKGSDKQGIRLARLERKIDALLKKFDVDYRLDVDPEVLELAMAGRKLEAIKRFREKTGASLRDAKEYVEQLQ